MLITSTHSKLTHYMINTPAYLDQRLLAKLESHLLSYINFRAHIELPVALLQRRFFFHYGTE